MRETAGADKPSLQRIEESLGRQRLQFEAPDRLEHVGVPLRRDLSAVAVVGDTVFAACDETSTIERLLRRENGSFRQDGHVVLGEIFELPAGKDGEMDIEGLAIDGGYLWITGSHSLKRDDPEEGATPHEAIEAMAELDRDPNRCFLGRVPLVDRAEGVFEPLETIQPVGTDSEYRRAACLKMDPDDGSTIIQRMLRKDSLLEPSLSLPGKENGFDVEGIAVRGDRVLLGLRGPVIGGLAVVLEMEMKVTEKGWLKPKKIGKSGARYRRHLLDLAGFGIRDLRFHRDRLKRRRIHRRRRPPDPGAGASYSPRRRSCGGNLRACPEGRRRASIDRL